MMVAKCREEYDYTSKLSTVTSKFCRSFASYLDFVFCFDVLYCSVLVFSCCNDVVIGFFLNMSFGMSLLYHPLCPCFVRFFIS